MKTLTDLFATNWNVILLIIGGCSVLAFAIFIERMLFINKAERDTNQLLIALRQAIKEGNIVDAVQICEVTGGAIAAVVRAGIVKHSQSRERVESAMELAALVEIAQLEKNAKILSVIAYIAPLIGLLGTVLGFIQAFSEMRMSGLVDISATRIGEAMEYALVTTAAGLVVAIPSVLAYNYLASRIASFVLEMETCSSEVVDLLIYRDKEEWSDRAF